MKKPSLGMDEVRDVLDAATPTSRLGRWFARNRAEFAETVQTVRPHWEALAVMFAERELIVVQPAFWAEEDTPERRLARKRAAEAVRQVWHRVKRQAGQPPTQMGAKPVVRKAATRGTRPTPHAQPATDGVEEFEFRTLSDLPKEE